MASTALDDEITALEAQAESLKKQVKLEASTLLSNITARKLLSGVSRRSRSDYKEIQSYAQAQEAHKQRCLYRACAGITTFKVRDPDPNAVDGGTVLGVRIEAMTRAKFIRPYYVLLNRPYGGEGSRYLRVHRHTVPPCIPLSGLAARYLPAPPSKTADEEEQRSAKKQDLARFVRTLRREIVRYHNRVALIADLRKAVGLDAGKRKKKGVVTEESPLLDISAADTELKQIKIEWKDGRTGRLIIGDDGEVVKLVVFGEKGRDRDATRELLGRGTHFEDVAKKMGAV